MYFSLLGLQAGKMGTPETRGGRTVETVCLAGDDGREGLVAELRSKPSAPKIYPWLHVQWRQWAQRSHCRGGTKHGRAGGRRWATRSCMRRGRWTSRGRACRGWRTRRLLITRMRTSL
ncbi:hypothetical protein CLOM_g24164 [Closterium sp. NIES-68]|nr:hypothetical protein CLOM_g24164 [Closterium sp. NIES-68]GJP86597.1 hypothetical protein CLOP_g16599 [Closterium sp. NIES-67]